MPLEYNFKSFTQTKKNFNFADNVAINLVCFVDIDNSNTGKNGLSWNTAFIKIQDCIDELATYVNGGEIWVKSGTYKPTDVPEWKQRVGKTSQTHKSFIMKENVRMYGGFDGTESSRSERNFKENPTYLSCNLGNGAYCNQILQGADNSLIDGFIFVESQYEDSRRRRLANSISVQEVLSSTSGNSGGGVYLLDSRFQRKSNPKKRN